MTEIIRIVTFIAAGLIAGIFLCRLFTRKSFAKRALASSDLEADLLFTSIPNASCTTDKNGKILLKNARFKKYFSGSFRSLEDYFSYYILDFPPDGIIDRSLEWQENNYDMRGVRYLNKDGENNYLFIFSKSPLQEAMHSKMEHLENRYHKLIKELPIGIALFDENLKIYYLNDRFLQMVDLPTDFDYHTMKITDYFQISENFLDKNHLDLMQIENASIKMVTQSRFGEKTFSVQLREAELGSEHFVEAVFQDISLETALYTKLNEKNTLLEEELSTARIVQEHILNIPAIYYPGVRFKTYYLPSHQLGGDFYDLVPLDNTHFAVVIADVAGHGVSASLISSMLKILIEFAPKIPSRIDSILSYLQNSIHRIIPEDSFVTLFYGIIDSEAHTMEYINCGHPFPILLDDKTRECTFLTGMGFPLGTFKEINFDEVHRKVNLPEACKLFFYTDGLLSFKNENRSVSFDDVKLAFENSARRSMESVLSSIYREIISGSTRLVDDDVSMLLLSLNKNVMWKRYISIPSSVIEVDVTIVKVMDDVGRMLTLSQEDTWKIYTVLYEAVINAVEHGNKLDVHKRVNLIYRLMGSWLILKIHDEGPGFRPKAVPNPLELDNLLKPSGRGIYMMEKIADRVSFNRKGNEVTLFLKLGKNTEEADG